MHMPGTKLTEEGVDKNHGLSKCVEFVSFLFFICLSFLLFFFHASICMKNALVGWIKSSRTSTQEKRNMEEPVMAGLGPKSGQEPRNLCLQKKHLKLGPSTILQGPDDIRKNKS